MGLHIFDGNGTFAAAAVIAARGRDVEDEQEKGSLIFMKARVFGVGSFGPFADGMVRRRLI